MEDKMLTENEAVMINLYNQKTLLEPQLKDAEEKFGKDGEDIKNYMPMWIVAQVEFAVGFAFLNQFPMYVQAMIVAGEAVVSAILIYDMQKYFRKKNKFLKLERKYSQVKGAIKDCKSKLTQEEKAYLVLEEGVNLSE